MSRKLTSKPFAVAENSGCIPSPATRASVHTKWMHSLTLPTEETFPHQLLPQLSLSEAVVQPLFWAGMHTLSLTTHKSGSDVFLYGSWSQRVPFSPQV